jgi:hypothetical protein
MHDGSQGNPMTEVALALAMGFFSIMVLTIVSMGAGTQSTRPAAAAVLTPASDPNGARGAVTVKSEDVVIVYHQGRYFDSRLAPLEPEAVASAGRVILAIDPALPLGEAMAARARFANERLVVSTLGPDWLRALAAKSR